MHDGDGTTQGNCDSGFLCYADGNCKGKIWAFIVTLYIRKNGYLNQTQCLFARHNSIIQECVIDSDCTGDSDTCVSNVCVCGSTEKCSGGSTCVIGKCKCGEHEECSETESCINGECQGIWNSVF